MADEEATQSNDAPESAPSAPIPDWSHVLGFQVLSAAPAGAEGPGAELAKDELAKELGVRAARFKESVDDSIVLASDGVIRWLGDPIAKLVAGDDLLKPRSVLLADDALSAEGREAVQTRLALWIAAHIHKVLGPLEALSEPSAVAEPVRDLAGRIVQALGVLERERVRAQVKTLDQSARSALRKLGVRFGATYIYVPALLKPGARMLCSQLWALRRTGEGEAGAERLLAFAASGRTSFAAEAPLAPDTYRVAGFRLCGDRVVRIDIVERLTDLIRAAIPDHMRPGGRPADDASGFVITPQMTSLTGCSGESFASILKSLGFESHKVKKADFEAATRKPAATTPAPVAEPTPVAEDAATRSSDSADGRVEPDGPVDAAADLAPPDASVDTVADRVLADTPAVAVDDDSLSEASAATGDPAGETARSSTESTSAPDAPSIEPDAPVDAVDDRLLSEAPVDPIDPAAVASPAEDEWIEVWRPAPRRRPQPAPRPRPAQAEGEAGPPRQGREFRRPPRRDRDAGRPQPPRDGAAAPAPSAPEVAPAVAEAGRPDAGEPNRQGRGRPHPFRGKRNDDRRPQQGGGAGAKETPPPPPRKEPRPAPVNMDSPFAKLLDLKPLLERRDKRT